MAYVKPQNNRGDVACRHPREPQYGRTRIGCRPLPEGPPPKASAHSPQQGLSDHTQQRIGLHLRAMYDTIVQQPVPDRFRDLIAKLDASTPDPEA